MSNFIHNIEKNSNFVKKKTISLKNLNKYLSKYFGLSYKVANGMPIVFYKLKPIVK